MSFEEAVNQLRKHIECPVCLETLASPKLLPCGHKFCEKCVPVAGYGYSREVTCPLCRSRTKSSPRELPTDTLVANIKEHIKCIERKLEAARNCAVCMIIPATVRCLGCQASLCRLCRWAHYGLHGNNHIVVTEDPSLQCGKHDKDAAYVCVDCLKNVCFCCIHGDCISKHHRYLTAGDALEEYFKVKYMYREVRDMKYVGENYPTLKERLISTFNTASTRVQKYSDDVIKTIEEETNQIVECLEKIKADALTILEAAKTSTDGFKKFADSQRWELPVGLFKNLPNFLRPEVQQSNDNYNLEDIVFEPNANITIGRVRLSLSKSESNSSGCDFPNLYGSQIIGVKSVTTEIDGDLRKFTFTLSPDVKGSKIADLAPDDVLLSLRYLF